MTTRCDLLITAASRRVAMIRGFRKALTTLGVDGDVHVCDTDPLSAGLRFCDKSHMVPLSGSPDYIPRILEICRQENISLVVPTIDEELVIFARQRHEFEAAGVVALISNADMIDICSDKYRTASFFATHNFPFAKTILPDQLDFETVNYPLFIKPRHGRGSVKAYPVGNERELRFFLEYVHEPIIQPFLGGAEYTIDLLAGLDGRIISVVPRQRIVIRAGVCDRGRTSNNPELIQMAARIGEKLGVVGPINLQCKVENGSPTFFEINARFSGAIQLTVAAGADFFSMIIEEVIGRTPGPQLGNFCDGMMMLSYEESVFEQF